MLATIEAHAVHRFLIQAQTLPDARTRLDSRTTRHTTEPPKDGLMLWLLTPDARITTSSIDLPSPGLRVAKLLYREAREADRDCPETEIMQIPQEVLRDLYRILRLHHNLSFKECMQDWHASFLERYEMTPR